RDVRQSRSFNNRAFLSQTQHSWGPPSSKWLKEQVRSRKGVRLLIILFKKNNPSPFSLINNWYKLWPTEIVLCACVWGVCVCACGVYG
ncbi:Hypothetical protein SMAX5B_001384, partial [Scophthalmus maximus]